MSSPSTPPSAPRGEGTFAAELTGGWTALARRSCAQAGGWDGRGAADPGGARDRPPAGDLEQADGRTLVLNDAPRLPAPEVLHGGAMPGVSITEQADPLALAALVDGAAPAVLDIGVLGSATIELTVRVRARPAPGWLACRTATRHVIGGCHEDDFEIWDLAGRLVAQSRRFALLPG